VVEGLGIQDAIEIELNALASNPAGATTLFAKMVSMRARIGWSTHGHSAVDVNVYSSGGPAAEKLHRNVENTDIGNFLAEYLDVDVEPITKELREKMGRAAPSAEQQAKIAVASTEADSGVHPAEWFVDSDMHLGRL
jgi:alkaline phosphatase